MNDPYYTNPDIAARYVEALTDRWRDPGVLFVEPSAGMGAFVEPLNRAGRNVRAMDIAPQADGIERGDFFLPHDLFAGEHSAVVVLGNPPFGKNASMAVRFFNHAAMYADEIAFIVPRTFRKISLQRRLHSQFHLTADEDVPGHAFILHGAPYDVPCAWQTWTRRAESRQTRCPPSVDHLIAYTSRREADFAVRRVGFYAGRVITAGIVSLSESTHYFMRERGKGRGAELLSRIDWSDVVAQTAGPRSLAKSEIAIKLSEAHRG